jgi:RHS repeat-associated protein
VTYTGACPERRRRDGDGKRVKKDNGTLYWYDVGGRVIEETDLNGNLVNDYIYALGMRLARRDAAGNVYTYLNDPLGSPRVIIDPSQSVCYEGDFLPFGEERPPITNNCSQNYKFTGMERDSETGLDHTLYRQLSSTYGRWLSPDPDCFGCTNPQKLNRYAYVLNNPVTLTDPLGLFTQSNPPPNPGYGPPAGAFGNVPLWCVPQFDKWGMPEFTCTDPFQYSATPTGVGGGAGASNSETAPGLIAAKQRVKKDLDKPECAKDFGDVDAAKKHVDQAIYNDLGKPTFETDSDLINQTSGYAAMANELTGQIYFNSEVNWIDPDKTSAVLDGQSWVWAAASDAAQMLGVDSLTAAQFIEIVLLHEVAHIDGKIGNPNDSDVTKKLFDDCMKGVN